MNHAESILPENLEECLRKGVLKRLPLTVLPFVNQQLREWNHLFPNERRSVERLVTFVAELTPEQSDALFRELVGIEDKMGVRHWKFSTSEQTIQNSSQLAASPYFADWRKAVQSVFDAADEHASKASGSAATPTNRLILIGIPRSLALDPQDVWRRWQGAGRALTIDGTDADLSRGALEFLLAPAPGMLKGRSSGLLDSLRQRTGSADADAWVVDAQGSLIDALLATFPAAPAEGPAVLLSYPRLDPFRQNFSHEMNTMRKDLADADAVFDRLRSVDVTSWCPKEVSDRPDVSEFVRALYLSGNGAVIFGNSFVEWAASEAFRRARPTFLAAQFGARRKPKAFTGVAVFENPDQVNPLPAVDDLPGSAIDAQMLALYVWLAASRFEEYQRSTVCVCLAESISQAYVVAPPQFGLSDSKRSVSLQQLRNAMREWMA
jgi:hypothetical protein